MSRTRANEPVCSERSGGEGCVEVVIRSRSRDLGGLSVRRILPAPKRRMVGPFIFLDEMGPVEFAAGEGLDVRPHPHIGLATVTFLFDGELVHRDSLGVTQVIRPGAVNLMTAGRGIVHSERTAEARREGGQRLHGLQIWLALPGDHEDGDPEFVHHAADALPGFDLDGVRVTLVLGRFEGRASPVAFPAEALYLVVDAAAGASLRLPAALPERAVYVVDGSVEVGATTLAAGEMAVLSDGPASVRARDDARLAVIGGRAVGERHIRWNFVHSDPARLEAAAEDWRAGRFAPVPGDDDFVPLPER